MAIQLQKGGRIDLQKEAPALKRARIGLSWHPNSTNTGFAFDLDVTAFGLKHDATGKPKLAGNDADFMVFYNNLRSIDGAIVHTGDNRAGDAEGDDESITVDFTKLRADMVDEISFVVTIHEATDRRQNFGQIPKSAIRVYDDETNALIAEYNLEEDFSSETAVQFGSIYKRPDGHFGFKAIGAGYNVGLAAFVVEYGGQVA